MSKTSANKPLLSPSYGKKERERKEFEQLLESDECPLCDQWVKDPSKFCVFCGKNYLNLVPKREYDEDAEFISESFHVLIKGLYDHQISGDQCKAKNNLKNLRTYNRFLKRDPFWNRIRQKSSYGGLYTYVRLNFY